MKKQIYWMLTAFAALTLSFVSCNGKGSANQKADPLNDSMAMAIGYMQGLNYSQQMQMQNAQAEGSDTLNRAKFLEGFQKGISMADPAQYAYYLGLVNGMNVCKGNMESYLNNELFKKYFVAAFKGDSTQIKWSENAANDYYQRESEAFNKRISEKKYGENKTKGAEYIKKFSEGKDVKTLPSGVAYKVLTPGKEDGATPTAVDTVKVNYKGHLIDSEEPFDSSYDRGEPAVFPVDGVIPGWTEMLQQMKEGEKVEVVIPFDKAYGENGSGRTIPPYSTLVFEVELLQVIPAAAPATK